MNWSITVTPAWHWRQCWVPPVTPRGRAPPPSRRLHCTNGKVLRHLSRRRDGYWARKPRPCLRHAETPIVEPENECVRTLRRVEAAVNRAAWSEVEQAHARIGSIESRRKIVGFERIDLPCQPNGKRSGEVRSRYARGADRSADRRYPWRASRADPDARGHCGRHSRGAAGRDAPARRYRRGRSDRSADLVRRRRHRRRNGRVGCGVRAARGRACSDAFENECVRVVRRLDDAYDRVAWDEVEQYVAAVVSLASHRKIVGQDPADLPFVEWLAEARRYRETMAEVRYRHEIVAVRGERLALTSFECRAYRSEPRRAAGRIAPAIRPRRGRPNRTARVVRRR